MSEKEKIKAAVSKLRKRDPRVIAIRNMIALAKAKGTPGDTGKDGIDGMRGADGISGKDGVDGLRGADGAHGAKGLDGSKGEIGAVGPQGDKGDAGMVWRGTYRNDTQYDIGDVVGVNGSAYVCVAQTNQSPPVGFGWELLVSRGAQGVRGIKGDDGGGGAAAAGTLTGATLAANVLASSLTSVGTLTAVNTSGVITGTNTTASTSSTTGALIIAGGAGIAEDSFINGITVGRGGTGAGAVASCTAFGASALLSSVGTNCTAMGNAALSENSGNSCTAMGTNALIENSGGSCTAIGTNALYQNTGGNCTAIGTSALFQNTVVNCTAIGTSALYQNEGISCTAVGVAALQLNTGGSCTAVGASALQSNSGASCTAVGAQALYANTSGTLNAALGANALGANTTGASNVGIGSTAGDLITTGSNNTIIGAGADVAANSNSNSIVIGAAAVGLGANTTVIGTSSTTAATVYGAVSVPSTTASTSSTTGALIVSGGAGFAKDININGVAAGIGAGTSNTKFGKDAQSQMAAGGDSCSAFGFQAGFWNSTGDGNSALGANCLLNVRTGSWNSGLGINALYTNQSGSHNVACGLEALYSVTSDNNTGIGSNSGYNLAGASTNNICIGYNAGKFQADGATALTTSSNSCYLGTGSRGLNNSDSNSIVIGAAAVGLGANTTVIGTSSTTSAKVWGTLTLDAGALISSTSATALALQSQIPAGTGVTPTIQIICPSAAFTLQNQTATQAVFPIPQDTITLQASTTYMFDGQYLLTTGATSHITSMSFVLTNATMTNCSWSSTTGMPLALNAATSGAFQAIFNSVAGGAVNTASTSANTMIVFRGIMRVNAAGTLVPNISFSAAPGVTCSTLVGSYIKFYPIGANTIDSVGTAIG